MCKVLLVDDEHLERQALKIIIGEEIEDVTFVGEAWSGRQAVELCKETDPDIIFMDIKMPVMNGIEATEIIKSIDRKKIVIMLTAYDDFKLAQNAIKARADDYVLKPARPEVIIETIKRHIGNIKSKESLSESQIQGLLNKIRCCDFRRSKEELDKVFKDISTRFTRGSEEFRANIKRIINKMVDVSKKMGLEINEITDTEFDSKISSLKNIFEIKIWIFEILDKIFQEIMEKKTYCSDGHLLIVLNYIEKNYYKDITLEDISNYVNLSSSYLSKLFKKEYKTNISTYITERRIERAKELLENTDMPVLNIAMDLSYNESNYFSKVFKKVVGMTPSEYRNEKDVVN